MLCPVDVIHLITKVLDLPISAMYHFELFRGLEKSEARMAKLAKGLDEVDRKVAGLRETFEKTTQEAAKMKMELDKATETITAADNLVGKLEGEYQRWSGQVRPICQQFIYS